MGFPGVPDGSVWSASLNGSGVRNVIPPDGLNTPRQLVIDQSANKLYICDREGLRIVRCNLDGGELEDVVRTGDETIAEHRTDPTRWCVGVSLDLDCSKIYWTQKGPSRGNKGRICRANIDLLSQSPYSSKIKPESVECVVENLPEPIDLDIDNDSRILYWTDRGDLPYGKSLNRCHISVLDNAAASGMPIRAKPLSEPPFEVLVRNLNEPIGLKVDTEQRRASMADLGGSLYSVSLEGGGKVRLFEDLANASASSC